jgi:hypothetical protein
MHLFASARRAGLLLLLGTGVACDQSALPAISPTEAPRAGHAAQVYYSQGKLEIDADNSSLNQILLDVSRETGMKITGSLLDESVYGKYGPAPPAEVLASLLNGTNSNMLLRQTASYAPAELILTPRLGGPTPPDPHAPGFDDAAPSETPALARRQAPVAAPLPPSTARPGINQSGRPFYPSNLSAPATPSTLTGANGGTDTPSADTSNPTSPNGVKTPQQIYQQLQQLMHQQQATQK